MAGQAIGRRGRVLKRAHQRAQRRFHAMFDAGLWSDPQARVTRLYVEAERLVDGVMAPEVHQTPMRVVVDALRWPVRDESDELARYWNRGA